MIGPRITRPRAPGRRRSRASVALAAEQLERLEERRARPACRSPRSASAPGPCAAPGPGPRRSRMVASCSTGACHSTSAKRSMAAAQHRAADRVVADRLVEGGLVDQGLVEEEEVHHGGHLAQGGDALLDQGRDARVERLGRTGPRSRARSRSPGATRSTTGATQGADRSTNCVEAERAHVLAVHVRQLLHVEEGRRVRDVLEAELLDQTSRASRSPRPPRGLQPSRAR